MSADETNVELEGRIREFSLLDIVQFLSSSLKTGRLRMEAPDSGEGLIYFDAGTVVHAQAAGAVGEEAFFALMRWNDGQFSFEPDRTTPEATVRQSSTNLLLEAARREDEWGVLSESIPDVRMIPVFLLPDEAETGKQITLNTSEWVVLSKIDGERSIQEIAQAASFSDFHTCRLIYPLVVNNLIRLREPRG